jgi:hypothetical protein
MNPRQRRLRRQRRKARVRDAEEARLELVELKRAAERIAAQAARKPTGGALLAAMLKGEKA